MTGLKYTEILNKSKELQSIMSGDRYEVAVLSNMTVAQIKEILEYSIRLNHINGFVEIGNYDNIVQESLRLGRSNLCIIFWELANVSEWLPFRADLIDDEQKRQIITKVKMEMDVVFTNLRDTSLVLINRFSTLIFNSHNINNNAFDEICSELNHYLEEKKNANTIIVDIDRILARVSIDRSVDFRNYYSSKALYSLEFYKEYANFINPIIISANGKAKKVLIFDCDNTLWNGILGEDGPDGIDMSINTSRGAIFNEIQHIALTLNKKGILLGICSKNNTLELEEVISGHPDMKIRAEHFTIKKVNWDDKTINLSAISAELNVGLDSLVFVDDSAYEVDYVSRYLPEVTTLQVPGDIYEYPKMLREATRLFYQISGSSEDLQKVHFYEDQNRRLADRETFVCIEDYLRSLSMKIRIYIDDEAIVPRMAQLTQKTNQFNLTTQRYTDTDINNFTKNGNSRVFAFYAEDKFGIYGITGLAILRLQDSGQTAEIDSFLMSCRVIGRNIEFAFFDYICNYLRNHGVGIIKAKYKKTIKNEQVMDFYDRLGFVSTGGKNDVERWYSLSLSEYSPKNIAYIEVLNERQN